MSVVLICIIFLFYVWFELILNLVCYIRIKKIILMIIEIKGEKFYVYVFIFMEVFLSKFFVLIGNVSIDKNIFFLWLWIC